ncbi:VQ motif-containing protein 11 [Trifolium pratense]|uniref:VQ motif-containing protein 11 n=1 Tax=Trifolium pratense TaxID=57577 RepID=UPI001E696987|nr:VQ motif-containing protein 11 [Trifolium pratense]
MHSPTYGSDPTTPPNTTFIQADPSNFRQVVQKLTGASQDPSAQKLPITLPSRLTAQTQANRCSPSITNEPIMGLKKPNFKLHERRSKKLQLNVSETHMMFQNNNNNNNNNMMMMMLMNNNNNNINRSVVMASPVSPLEFYMAHGNSPKSPYYEDEEDEEEKVIAEKGFYLHPSPRASQQQPPELLPLFPLHSPSSQSHS